MLNRTDLDKFAGVAVKLGESSHRYSMVKEELRRQKAFVKSLDGWLRKAPSREAVKQVKSDRRAVTNLLRFETENAKILDGQVNRLKAKLAMMKTRLLASSSLTT